jgi:nitrilase
MDAAASVEKAVGLIDRAAKQGAQMVVFAECFIPGYCQWAHSSRFEDAKLKKVHARLIRNSVRVPDDLGAIAEAAKRGKTTVAIGVTERDPVKPAVLFNTLAVFGPEGNFLGKHRKLVPTHHERTVHNYGGGEHLRAFEVNGVRFGGLLCWENYMPVARYALYAQGVQIYLAPTADDTPSFQTAVQFIARESRAFVVSPSLLQRKSHFPKDFELRGDPAWEAEGEWNERGGSVILAPGGEVLQGPVYEDETILFADLDLDRVLEERHGFDPAGHFARSDVLRVDVEGLGRF